MNFGERKTHISIAAVPPIRTSPRTFPSRIGESLRHDLEADAGEAAALAGELLRDGDVALVKASNGMGLWAVAEALAERAPASGGGA